MDGSSAVAEAGYAYPLRVDDPSPHNDADALLQGGKDAAKIGPSFHILALKLVTVAVRRQPSYFARTLKAQHSEAVSGEKLDRIFVAGAAAKKSAAVILHDDQRMALARSVLRRKDEIAKRLNATIIPPFETLYFAQLQPRKLRIEIDDGSDPIIIMQAH